MNLLVFTDRTRCRRPLPDVIAVAVDHGARTVVLRERDLPAVERDRLADALRLRLAPVGGALVVAGTRGPSVHLAAHEAYPRPEPTLVGRSCHDEAEVRRAVGEACDYVSAFVGDVDHGRWVEVGSLVAASGPVSVSADGDGAPLPAKTRLREAAQRLAADARRSATIVAEDGTPLARVTLAWHALRDEPEESD